MIITLFLAIKVLNKHAFLTISLIFLLHQVIIGRIEVVYIQRADQ